MGRAQPKARTVLRRALLVACAASAALAALAAVPQPAEAAFTAVGSTSYNTSPDGTAWSPAVPYITTTLKGVAHGNGLFVAVGASGAVQTSPDGWQWTAQASGTTQQFNGVATGDMAGTPLFAAVGPYYTAQTSVQAVYTSPNGAAWTPQATPLPYSVTQNAIAYGTVGGAGRMVSVGLQGSILSSTDAVAWTPRASGVTDTLYGVGFGNGEFIAVGAGGKMLASPDGAVWTNRTSGTTVQLNGIAYGNGLWVAVGNSRTILTSPDGIAWTPRTPSGVTNTPTLYGVAHGGGRWVIASYSTYPNSTTYSSPVLASGDGINWAPRPATAYYSYGPMAVVYGGGPSGGQFVAVGNAGAIVRSPDGLDWVAASMRAPYIQYGVAHDNGRWVSVGYYGSAFTSPDGRNWTRRHTGIGCCNHLNAVAYGAGQWVAVGNAGTIITSADGIRWSAPASSGTSQALYGVGFRAGQWVAVGGSGTIIASDDGVAWSARASPTGNVLRGVAWGGGNWTAVGYSGTILGSPDGIAWAARASPTTSSLYAVSYDPQAPAAKWTATGASGTAVTSANGVAWATVPSGTTTLLYGVARDAGRWAAIGSATGVHSIDAAAGTWATASPSIVNTPYAVAADRAQPLACLPALQAVGVGQPATVGGGGGVWPYAWDAAGSNLPGPVQAASVTRTYAALGTYQVTVTDSFVPARSASCTVDVVANPPPPPSAAPTTACGYILRDSTTTPGLYDFTDIDPAVGGGGTGIPNLRYYTTYAVRPTPATPFNFRLCGTTYQTFWLSGAGYVCMGPVNVATGTTSGYPSGCTNYSSATSLPNPPTPNAAVYGQWNILNPAACPGGSTACSFYKVEGTAPDRVLVYEHKGVPVYYATAGRLQTMQIKLFEATGCIEVHYKDIGPEPSILWYPNVAGFESASGTLGYTYAYGSAPVGITRANAAWSACPFTALPDAYTFNEDQEAQDFDVTANDITGGAVYAVTSFTQPAKGNLTGPAGGRFTYRPDADQNGADSFTYTIRDSSGRTSTGTVSLAINPVNDPPAFAAPAAPIGVALSEGVREVPGWATGVAAGPATAADEAGQAIVFDLASNSNPGIFRTPPSLRRTATALSTAPVEPPTSGGFASLRLDLASAGEATLCFRARDSGGTATATTANLDPQRTAAGVDAGAPHCVAVAVNGPPVAYFDASTPAAAPGQAVAFDACPLPLPSCSHDADGTLVDLLWSFGDGATAHGGTAVHAFAGPGVYVVRLVVTDDVGLTGTMERTLRVAWPDAAQALAEADGSVAPPMADAGGDLAVPAGARATLHGAARGATERATFQWSQVGGPAVALEGDLTPGLSFAAPHLPDGRPVQLAFALTVSDGARSSAPDVAVVTVIPGPARLAANAGGSVLATVGQPVALQGASLGGAGPVSYSWAQAGGPPVDLSGAGTETASFTAPGEPAVLRFRLTASDGAATGHDEAVVYVLAAEAPPVGAGIRHALRPAPGGADVEFVAVGVEDAAWDFGDGQAGAGPRVVHRYAPGSYEVAMRSGGATYTERVDVPEQGEAVRSQPVSAHASAWLAGAAGLLVLVGATVAVAVARRQR